MSILEKKRRPINRCQLLTYVCVFQVPPIFIFQKKSTRHFWDAFGGMMSWDFLRVLFISNRGPERRPRFDLLLSSLSSHHPHLTVGSITSYLPLYIHTTTSLFPSLTHVSQRFFAALAPSIGQKYFVEEKKYDIPFRISRRFWEGLSSSEVW